MKSYPTSASQAGKLLMTPSTCLTKSCTPRTGLVTEVEMEGAGRTKKMMPKDGLLDTMVTVDTVVTTRLIRKRSTRNLWLKASTTLVRMAMTRSILRFATQTSPAELFATI